jgi:AraC family transcriptional regulator
MKDWINVMPSQKETKDNLVKIIDFKETRVAVLKHRGDPTGIKLSVSRFIAWRQAVGLVPGRSATFNILYDHPGKTAPAEFRLDLCAATEDEVASNPARIVAGIIPGGRCAVLRHIGSDAGLEAALVWLCMEWLPRSGERRREFPLYLQRVLFFPACSEDEAVLDLFLPLL